MTTWIPLSARRVFRLALAMSLALAGAYGIGYPLPYVAPLLAMMLTLKPGSALPLKGFAGLVILVLVACGTGLLLITVLDQYPLTGFLLVGLGMFLSNYLTLNLGKGAVGSLLTVGLTMITAAGLASFLIGLLVVKALVVSICLAVACQHLGYFLFPEDPVPEGVPGQPMPAPRLESSNWLALRATAIVMPAYFVALTNPAMYLPLIMKSVSLGQEGSVSSTRRAGMELLGSTFAGGCLSILFWFALGLHPTLWMFFLWTLLFGIWIACRIYQLVPTRFPPSFWTNTAITVFILVGPAVDDSANGKDVYKAFAVRLGLFVVVTLYAWATVAVLERYRTRLTEKNTSTLSTQKT